jgi:hypothetical protein
MEVSSTGLPFLEANFAGLGSTIDRQGPRSSEVSFGQQAMTADNVIRDLSNGLLITARRRAIPPKILFSAAIPFALALFVLLYSMNGPLFAVGIFSAAAFGIFLRFSAASAQLLIARNDCERSGPFGTIIRFPTPTFDPWIIGLLQEDMEVVPVGFTEG